MGTPPRPSSNDRDQDWFRRSVRPMTATFFTGGLIWTGIEDTEAVLVADGVVRAVGDEARAAAADAPGYPTSCGVPTIVSEASILLDTPCYTTS